MAKDRGLPFELSLEQFLSFVGKSCFYCRAETTGVGLDRIDNLLGYSMNNIVPCCRQCNVAKNNHTQTSFFAMCLAVVRTHNLR